MQVVHLQLNPAIRIWDHHLLWPLLLEDAGLRDTDDQINMVPDMLMSGEDSGRANIWLRGIGSTKFDIGSEGSNAYFVDEIYMSRNQSI